jgi:hypothetical protein
MEADNEIENSKSLFDRYKDEITPAIQRGVREALRKHKLAGNPVPTERDGKMVWLQPEEMEVDD